MILGVILILLGIVAAAGYLPSVTGTTQWVAAVVLIVVGVVLAWKSK